MDAPHFTIASSDYEKYPRLAKDPIIDKMFKKRNHEAYKKIMKH